MNTRGDRVSRCSTSKSKSFQGEGPNWILIAGGALLTTLSIRLGYKLKQALGTKQHHNACTRSKGTAASERRRSSGRDSNLDLYSFAQEGDRCFNFISGAESIGGEHPPNGHMPPSFEVSLPLVTVPPTEFNKVNGIMWVSSPDRLELLPKPFHHSNCSDSLCVSESGSDIYSKREVIQKLRQQLKRRDDMIPEMQDQITGLQNSLNAQMAHLSHLQSQLDAANRDLFDSGREIQRLRKAIADQRVGHINTTEKTSTVTALSSDIRSSHHANGYLGIETYLDSTVKGRGDRERSRKIKRGDRRKAILVTKLQVGKNGAFHEDRGTATETGLPAPPYYVSNVF